MIVLLALLGLGAVQQALGADNGDKNNSGLSLRNVEKGLQSIGQGISKGARESGIDNGLSKAGNEVKNAGKRLEKKLSKNGSKSQDGNK